MKRTHVCSFLTASLLAVCSSAYAQYSYLPTNLAAAGLSYIVPDTFIWYGNTNHVSIGPVNIGDQLGNNGNWEPYCGTLGDAGFLIGFCSYALDGSATPSSTPSDGSPFPLGRQEYYVAFLPAGGGTPKVFSAFYDDYSHPFTNEISVRENGNPFHVTGDKRYGGTNYMTGGEGSPNEWNGNTNTFNCATNFFDSDHRWDYPIWAPQGMAATVCYDSPDFDYANRYALAQNFGIDPNNLAAGPTMLGKTLDVAFGSRPDLWNNQASSANQYGRWGGDLACLSDGNFVCGIEDRSGFFPGSAGQNSIIGLFTPTGTPLMPSFLLAPKNFWTGIAAFKGGFCVRVGSFGASDWSSGNYPYILVPPTNTDALLFFFDNDGNCYATNAMVASSGLSFANAGARGDGTGIGSDVRSYYVYYTDKVPGNSGTGVVAIWDGRTGAFVTNANWTTTIPNTNSLDRFGVAVDALDRFCVSCDLQFDSSLPCCYFQDVARVGSFDGKKITWLTPMFFPFINHETNYANLKGIETGVCPYVMMNTKEICICAKAYANSTNNPAAGPNTYSWDCNGQGKCPPATPDLDTGGNDRTFIYTIFTHPQPVNPPVPKITFSRPDPAHLVLSYPADDGLFRLQHKTASLGLPDQWTDVSPQPARVPLPTFENPSTFQFTVTIGTGPEYFRLVR